MKFLVLRIAARLGTAPGNAKRPSGERSRCASTLKAGDQASAGAEQSESAGRVQGALSQLPESQGRALQLAFYGGLTHAQIAERMDVPLGTAKTWIRRGMEQMKSILDRRQEVSA